MRKKGNKTVGRTISGQVQIRIQIVGARIYQAVIPKVLKIPESAYVFFKTMASKENMLKISW